MTGMPPGMPRDVHMSHAFSDSQLLHGRGQNIEFGRDTFSRCCEESLLSDAVMCFHAVEGPTVQEKAKSVAEASAERRL